MPQRRVYLDAFYIDKYPVTNVQFRRFGRPRKDYGTQFNGARQPVVGVTWSQARDFCESVGKRLPTDAEWEKAARGVNWRKCPFGEQWDGSKIIWRKNSGGKTHPVKRTYNTHQGPYGAVDMVGNTYEWVGDRYKIGYYRETSERNPKGPASGSGRVVRGGSWSGDNPASFRAATRTLNHPDNWFDDVSFRCAKTP